MAIDITKDFSKKLGFAAAKRLVIQLLIMNEVKPAHLDIYNVQGKGKQIFLAYGELSILKWKYDGINKVLHVEYTDGRPKPEEKTKPEFFIVWIEGLSPKTGEKILSLDRNNHEYTTSMTKAMRVKLEDIDVVKRLLKEQGVADWAINGGNTFCRVNYAPKGTLFTP